jgi:hypothetical protein
MAAAEQKKSYQVIKTFRGLDTQANRTAIKEDEFSWIENVQPIGYANLKVIPNYSTVSSSGNTVVWANTATTLSSANIKLNDYAVAFQADGSAQYYNATTGAVGNMAAAGTFSGAGMQVAQWKNERLLILDPSKGYYSWDGNNVVNIGSVGIIAVTNGGSGYTNVPTVTISAPNDTNGTQANAVATVLSGVVQTVSLNDGGSGYYANSVPTITIAGGGGSGATAIAGVITFATGTASAVVVSGGTGYTNAANTVITFSGGGGTGAAGTAVLKGGQILEVIITNPGSGYTNAANLVVTASGGGGTGAVLKGIVNSDSNVGIASFSGRVWIAAGRTIYYSAVNSYTDFTSVSAGSFVLTDETLHGNIQQILSANNFLYIFGDDSINVISNVNVNTNGITLFTNTNVSASVGSKRPYAIFPYFRSVLFLNDYGVYALVGSTTSKLSDPLDGIFPNIDFTYPIYAGQVLINNILCAAFNFRYYDAVFTQSYRYIQAVFFEKKWFLTSQGNNLAYITSIPLGGKITLFGTDGTTLYQLYQSTSAAITSRIQTALLPMGDPIRTKQALKMGIEATATNASSITMSATIDSESGSSPPYTLTSHVTWINNNLQTVAWTNNSSATIGWGQIGYALYKTDASQYGKYLGITVTSSNPAFTVNGFEFEHELRVRF